MTARAAQLAPVAGGADWPWLQSAIEMASFAGGRWPAGPGAASARWRTLPRVATRTPALAPHSVTTARAFTLRTMLRWGVADRSHDVASVVSELLTNALRHALPQAADASWPAGPGRVRLGLLSAGHSVLCAVADPSTQAPVLRQPDWLDESGRGLQLVASLSENWGYCATPEQPGKVVWATFTSTRAPQPELDIGSA
jgi:anti-sigma regulatory factor (Ser/Thr protein kinase)